MIDKLIDWFGWSMRVLQDANLPKFLSHDVPLFLGILSDLFPTISPPEVDYGSLTTALQQTASTAGLQVCVVCCVSCVVCVFASCVLCACVCVAMPHAPPHGPCALAWFASTSATLVDRLLSCVCV